MNLTHNLEQFTNELTDIFNRLVLLKHDYPTLFKEVLPSGGGVEVRGRINRAPKCCGRG
jgi:hypothetical protein